jgi:large subunit ribosomal protein L35
MPKLKTHKGAAARIHITGSGKLMRRKRMSSHLRRKKPAKVTRKYSDKLPVDPADLKRLGNLLPYRFS